MTLLLTESFVLAAVGTVLGLLLAQFAVDWIVPRLPGVDARFGAIGIDWRVIGFSVLLALITAFTFGLLPALRMSKVDLRSALAGTGPARDQIDSGLARRALVLAQVALAVVLVVSAGLLLRSLWTLWQVEPGFQGSQVLSASLDPAEGFYAEPAKRSQFYGRVLERLAALPGVDSTAAAYGLPLTRMRMGLAHRVRGQQNEDGRLPVAQQRIVTPGYFRTMGIPILQGRDFRPSDDSEAPPVVIINRKLAEQIWPGQSALGEAVGYPWPSDWLEVVGVVENVLLDDLTGGMEPIIYFPYAQRSMTSMTVLARTRLDPLLLGSSLRTLVHEIDPNVPVNDIRTVDAVAWESIARPRFVATLLTLFAVTALLLGAIGIYGVIAYLVDQRRHEIGIRMALGASPAAIQTQFVKQGLMLGGAGLLIGMAGAFFATRWLESQLFQVRSTEPSILVLAAITLGLTALLASYFPARRVTRLDPLKALKAE